MWTMIVECPACRKPLTQDSVSVDAWANDPGCACCGVSVHIDELKVECHGCGAVLFKKVAE